MIGETKDKKYNLSFIEGILKVEFKHIKENWILFLVCFFIARQNIIDSIFPFAIVVLSAYSYTMGSSILMLLLTVFAIFSVQFNFVYLIILTAIFAYFFSFKEEKKTILLVSCYSSLVLFVAKTTILFADGFNQNDFMLNVFEGIFVFSSIVIVNELIKMVKEIKKGTKREKINTFKKVTKAKKITKAVEEAASTITEEKHIRESNIRNIRNISEINKSKYINIFTDRAKDKIKEQLLWQNINVKFFEVVSSNKDTIALSLTVKSDKSCEEAESAIELAVRNICGVKLKCTERVVASPNYYVLKFKNIKRIRIRTYTATTVKEGSEVSGDSFAYAGKADRYYTVLCDGIGSGKEAYNESTGAVDLLSKFLYTDFSEEQILRTLNTILMLKLGEERFVTFDFNIIDYGSREIRLYKAGAAPTYIVSKKSVDKITGKSLPMGILDNFEYSSFKKKIEIGDMIVMVSDGITDSIGLDEKKSLDKYLELIKNKDPQTIANSILSYALRGQDKIIDDMTVLVTKIG